MELESAMLCRISGICCHNGATERVKEKPLLIIVNNFLFYPEKQPPEVFYKKTALENSTIFTGKHLC